MKFYSCLLALSPLFEKSTAFLFRSQANLGLSKEGSVLEGPRFGVGFDLTASYGAAAVSFSNGTVVTVAVVTAANGYTETMHGLSLKSSQHLVPPYQNIGDDWIDGPREMLRKARKVLGLPASAEVGFFVQVLSELRTRVEEYLGQPIKSAAVAVFDLVALYQEDLQDVFEYVGLRYVPLPVRYDILYETSAAYAGYGYGLCSDYIDGPACKKEQQDMPFDIVMLVSCTRTALMVTLFITQSAYYLYEPVHRHLANFSFGYDAQWQWGAIYWDEVASNLERIMVENPYYPRPGKVLLIGDLVKDETFIKTLEGVLSRQMKNVPEVIGQDPIFAAAKGAAELAKRIPYDPYWI